MSIDYRTTTRSKMNDEFSSMLRETAAYFADKGIQMTNRNGFEEILSESSLFNDYKSHLCEGMEADQIENMEQLLENARMNILSEANTAGVQQIAGLAMPTIRKMWAKVALKHAIPTQVVATPRFAISYTKPYIMNSTGEKHYLPDAINDLTNNLAELPKVKKEYFEIAGMEDGFDLFAQVEEPWVAGSKNDSIDKVFYLEKIKATPTADEGGTYEEVEVRVHIKTDLQAMIHGQITIPCVITDDGKKKTVKTVTDTIFGNVDYQTGVVTLISTKGIISHVMFDARLSQEANEQGESVSFDILTKDVTIGVGTHINAPLPIEWLQDTMAIYNIDGAAEVVDLMSQTVAQKLEIEIYNFLVKSIEVNNVPYRGEFNLIPSAGYNGTPKSWREELKTIVDYFAIKMRTDSKFHGGKFMIIGNPLDMQLIPNVDWVFNHTSEQMSGVDVTFNLGAFSGANKYEMVSSDLVPQGALIMFFIPGIDRLMTYKYYPYTFNVERGYRDPNMPNVPSIMMTKRHTIEEFSPLICKIDIINNVGKVPATPGY